MGMLRLSAQRLKIDQPLPWDVYDEHGTLLLRKGFVISRETQIDRLLEQGMFVDSAALKESISPSSTQPKAPRYDPYWLWDDIQIKLAKFLRSLTSGGDPVADFPSHIMGLSALMGVLCERSPDQALATIMLMDQKRYPIAHTMHCAVLCELVGRRLQWPMDRRMSMCCAALTMNVAMLELQAFLCNQDGRLSPEQQQAVNRHPEDSVKMLMKAGVTDQEWLRTVLEHHEVPDGSGYPRKIKNPSEEAMLLHTTDVFSAKVAPRASRRPMAVNQAARVVFLQEGEANPFAALLIKEVGIFPPGTFVKLANGEIGVVQKRGPHANAPVVFSLVSGQGAPMLDPVRRDTTRKEFEVAAVVTREKLMVGFNRERIWGN